MKNDFGIKDYMTPIPYTIEPRMSVRVAVELMRRHGVRHLPVEEGDRLVGILSDWDILSTPSLEKVLDQSVSSIMVRKPVTLQMNSSVFEAVALMRQQGVGSVIVMSSDNRAVGIFTEKDAVAAWVEFLRFGAPPVMERWTQ